MKFFKHPSSEVLTSSIGEETKIWQYCVILEKAQLGKNCNICSHVFIENEVIVGNNVTIKSGVQLWDGIIIEDDVFIGPNVSFTNDSFPRSKSYIEKYPKTVIKTGASLGAGSTILPGIEIGEKSMVGAGSVVTKNVKPGDIVIGNPAKVIGKVDDY